MHDSRASDVIMFLRLEGPAISVSLDQLWGRVLDVISQSVITTVSKPLIKNFRYSVSSGVLGTGLYLTTVYWEWGSWTASHAAVITVCFKPLCVSPLVQHIFMNKILTNCNINAITIWKLEKCDGERKVLLWVNIKAYFKNSSVPPSDCPATTFMNKILTNCNINFITVWEMEKCDGQYKVLLWANINSLRDSYGKRLPRRYRERKIFQRGNR